MESIKFVTWNMNCRALAWERLAELRAEHGVQVALVHEAVPPPTVWRVHPAADLADAWRVMAHADRKRAYASAVVLLDDSLTMTPVEPEPVGKAGYGRFAVSHPGQFAVADVSLAGGASVTAISLYGFGTGTNAGSSPSQPCTERSATSPSCSKPARGPTWSSQGTSTSIGSGRRPPPEPTGLRATTPSSTGSMPTG